MLITALLILLAAQSSPPRAVELQAAATASADAAAMKQFDDAVARYVALRQGLSTEVRGPVKNSSSAELNGASDALAAAILRARKDAHVGSIFTKPAAAVITRRIAAVVRNERLAGVLASIDDDGSAGPPPQLHLRLPVTAQMATMPPALLSVLPPLPKTLEYRILGRYLVLRDVDASLIIDYIPAAVAR